MHRKERLAAELAARQVSRNGRYGDQQLKLTHARTAARRPVRMARQAGSDNPGEDPTGRRHCAAVVGGNCPSTGRTRRWWPVEPLKPPTSSTATSRHERRDGCHLDRRGDQPRLARRGPQPRLAAATPAPAIYRALDATQSCSAELCARSILGESSIRRWPILAQPWRAAGPGRAVPAPTPTRLNGGASGAQWDSGTRTGSLHAWNGGIASQWRRGRREHAQGGGFGPAVPGCQYRSQDRPSTFIGDTMRWPRETKAPGQSVARRGKARWPRLPWYVSSGSGCSACSRRPRRTRTSRRGR